MYTFWKISLYTRTPRTLLKFKYNSLEIFKVRWKLFKRTPIKYCFSENSSTNFERSTNVLNAPWRSAAVVVADPLEEVVAKKHG